MGDYQFLMLKDAITCINQKVNLFAVILDFTLPQRTKGTDYFCKLKVIDESHSEFWVPVHVFAQEIDGLPLVASVGDIIQLSRVTVLEWGKYATMEEETLLLIYWTISSRKKEGKRKD
ncbi:hypothetical protein Golob_008563 [Gossypium lobatum]|uniref:Telomeric single stranded DNA binding POT1/Cdc13 domain-containing protein n=1 Tax=Gossypium lobatum TaxID=34289 RepID=A0A7J8MFV5_9ROSI|nr:hypothetical protein [Gossypium lobatum]